MHTLTNQVSLNHSHSPYSGETAFFYLQLPRGAESDMVIGISHELGLQAVIPISFIHGSNSWIDSSVIKQARSSRYYSYFEVYEIPEAGHHVHADQPKAFNDAVNTILKFVDEDKDHIPVIDHRNDKLN